MWDFLLDIFFPRQCLNCGSWGKFICDKCKNKIQYFDNQVCPYCEKLSPDGLTHPRCRKQLGLDGMFVLAHYQGPIINIIRKIKYQGIYGASGEVAELILSRYHQQYNFDYFVPIPLHPDRERERGFNQAEKLAKKLDEIMVVGSAIKVMGIETRERRRVLNMLIRRRKTTPQFDLKYEERQKNVQGVFDLNPRLNTTDLSGISFCLVDDVATTGSTIFECAKVLKKSGAEKIYAVTIARGG